MMDPLRVVAAGDDFLRPSLIARAVGDALREHPPEVRELTDGTTEERLIEALAGARVLVTREGPVTARVLDARPELRLVVICPGGSAEADLDAAKARGVTVCRIPRPEAAATAEYALGLMLAALRRIPQTHELLAGRGDWAGAVRTGYEGTGLELEDLPVGLVGHGVIGGRVARVLCAFGAQVMVHDPYVRGEIHGLRVASLDELLTRSRVLTLHARLAPGTGGLIGARELALLPPGAVVVNAAQGDLLDEDALCDALESGRVSAAALDTYAREPVPDGSRLFGFADRVVLTPHLAGSTRAVAEKAARSAAEEVARWARGRSTAHCLV
ncbi:NAD(P)-dependent oxidoreductase [Streptomyces sp. CRN 30]|uniref:NAD(P)-dependent oxidoreductase n=1 Tax=Streptomyces sp. CRN 30 TaxID=3075613 RepID=UPI002A7ED4A3|nr:NAD(P)-dependent oxidoreductase [Streptomyces sp. CRN 30]